MYAMHTFYLCIQDDSKVFTQFGKESSVERSSAAIENVYEDIKVVGAGLHVFISCHDFTFPHV